MYCKEVSLLWMMKDLVEKVNAFFKFIGANTDCNQCANDHSRNKKGKKQPKVIHCNTSAINRFYGRTSLFTVSVSATNSGTVFKSAFPFRKSAAVF